MSETLSSRARRRRSPDPTEAAPMVVFAAEPPPTGRVELTFTVSALLHAQLGESARAAKQSIGSFAAALLGAAYLAQHRPTGHAPLDTAVARAVVLSRTHNTAEISAATGLSEAGVAQVIATWRAEIARGGAA